VTGGCSSLFFAYSVYVSPWVICKVRGEAVNDKGGAGKTAVIAGASGLLGSELLRQLLRSDQYSEIVALVRRPLPLEQDHVKLRQVTVLFGELPHLSAFAGADVYCSLGTTMKQAGSRAAFRAVDFDAIASYARIAADGGARQFLLASSLGANSQSKTFYLQVKGETEEALGTLPFKSLHIVRPSFLVEKPQQAAPDAHAAGVVVADASQFTLVGKLKSYSAVDVATLAAAMLSAARHSEPGEHKYEYEQILELAKT